MARKGGTAARRVSEVMGKRAEGVRRGERVWKER